MTPQQRTEIRRYLTAFDFSGLFTDSSLGWDWPDSSVPLRVPFEGAFMSLSVLAEKRGVKVLHVPPDAAGQILPSDLRKKLEKAVTPLATEHLLIFTDTAKTRQIWLWTSRLPGKPVSHRELSWEKGKANELLLQKLSSIAFTLDEEDALDITGVVLRLRDSLDRDKVTKRFYDQFKVQKDAFRGFIKGLTDGGLLDWYTSLMLNRLMFCYFLQRKGFLDGDPNYLSNRLSRVQEEIGEGQFHSFYKTFLRSLFHDGLGKPRDERTFSPELTKLIGEIPYLNGGIFEEHRIEREHPELHIPDNAFKRIFTFLNEWEWHLDDRPIARGDEINPEILGYVFEKYTNQKEMGAYYTKEDITDYIAKNCIIPFLLDTADDKLGDASWQLLRDDPNRYIYPAVGHGIFCDYPTGAKLDAPLPLPGYIEKGIDTTKRDLRVRRARWNDSATPELGLPTEIWRETVARRQRCEELQRKLRAGEVRAVNDLITLNLNIRQFAQDVVENAGPDLLLALFKAIRKVSVLDPTCGSGAFLFAALNILEPLYRACLERMRALLGDWETRSEKHPIYRKEFSEVLDQAARHPNENYFIFKSIIVHNLYGVDIMEEAVEICKLRLFLKLAAQLEPGQEIEPLPDIDFNIRAGNTLVGYASRDEVRRCMTQFGDGQMRLGVEDELQSYSRFEEAAENVDKAFQLFQQMQDEFGMNPKEFRENKRILSDRLGTLRHQLDRFLAADYDKKNLAAETTYNKWRTSHQPFHWFVEFHGILDTGGFHVIIGNPPWKEYAAAKKSYTIRNYATESSGNLYALCIERCLDLIVRGGMLSFIVQLPVVSSSRMDSTRQLLSREASMLTTITCDDRPGKLFDGLQHCRSTIVTLKRRTDCAKPSLWTTAYRRWATEVRSLLFPLTRFAEVPTGAVRRNRYPKLATPQQVTAFQKTSSSENVTLGSHALSRTSEAFVFYQESAQYWVKATVGLPHYAKNGRVGAPAHGRYVHVKGKELACIACAALNSSVFYNYFIAYGDCFHVNDALVTSFPLPPAAFKDGALAMLGAKLMRDLDKNADKKTINTKDGDKIAYAEFRVGDSKSLIDEIDAVLAEHYGFTEEELDFIINYDIKYRMGLSGGSAEDSEE